MRLSRFNRISVPTMGSDSSQDNPQPSPIARAQECPLRVLVRNNSFGASIYLAFSDGSLLTIIQGIGGDVFEIPAGASEVFVVAPNQTLYVATTANNAVASIAVSLALPSEAGDERRLAP